jgi:phosphoglycolate phosphatase-like HAD superfamily hydrolase
VSSARITAIFLDDGGVMSDNAIRGREWQRLVAEFLAPRLGGEPARWAEANNVVWQRQWDAYLTTTRNAPDGEFDTAAFWEVARPRWIREMCEHAGLAAPAADRCAALARETEAYVMPRVRASFPGAPEAIRALRGADYALYTASGHDSTDLEGILDGMGVRSCFGERLYGPDLIGAAKTSRRFHERAFADASIDAKNALVVDDFPDAIRWATAAGATTVLVARDGADASGAGAVIGSLAELPAIVGSI